MAIRDFSILFEPVQTATSNKDISLVSGFNAISQYIEHVLKTQKGELISNMNNLTESSADNANEGGINEDIPTNKQHSDERESEIQDSDTFEHTQNTLM